MFVALARSRDIYVADGYDTSRMHRFDAGGALIHIWGGPAAIPAPRLSLLAQDGTLLGRCRPVLNGAHGVRGDKAGNIYLAEMNPSRLTRLCPVA